MTEKPEQNDYDQAAIDERLRALDKKMYSDKKAYIYTAVVVAATLITGLVLAIAGAVNGGPNCDAEKTSFLCSRTWEVLFPLVPGLVSLFGCLGGFWRTYVEWKHFRNWRPWLAMCWVLMPFTLMWMVSTWGILIIGIK